MLMVLEGHPSAAFPLELFPPLLVFPPQALIEPGKTQAFRVQFVGDPDMTKSKHYFVTVAQLPVQLPGGSNAIQILYNFQVAVSVGVSGERSEITLTDSKIVKNEVGEFQPVLTFSNTGKTYGYVSEGGLRLTVKDAAGKEVFSKRYDSSDIEHMQMLLSKLFRLQLVLLVAKPMRLNAGN